MATKINAKKLRKSLNMTQAEFWQRLSMTQSAGSRYENGRDIPKPVKALIELAYGKKPVEALAKLRGVQLEDLVGYTV